MKPVKKAFEIDLSRINEGYLSDIVYCHAENANEAKSILLKKIEYDGWTLTSGEEVSYINIPVIRRLVSDLYDFEGEILTQQGFEYKKAERERINHLQEILFDENIKWCYIRKGMYYKPNSSGYTNFKSWAGVFTKEYAVSHATSVSTITVIPINIEEHNKMINTEIEDLKKQLI